MTRWRFAPYSYCAESNRARFERLVSNRALQ
nr:MAG TPA: hypothetical protein [Caudoviricetes sp.]